MKNDIVEIIGVYRLDMKDIIFDLISKKPIEDYEELDNPENAKNAVIVEMIIKKPLREIDIGKITQTSETLPRDSWQAVYDEVFLNESGTEVIDEKDVRNGEHEAVRFFFFFHYLDFDKPILTPFGDVPIPVSKPTKKPKRLEGKIEYHEP